MEKLQNMENLLTGFGNAVNILKYYGDLKSCQHLMAKLSSHTRQCWADNRVAFHNSFLLEGNIGERNLIPMELKGFTQKETKFLSKYDNTQWYSFTVELKTKKDIQNFCEFIDNGLYPKDIHFEEVIIKLSGKNPISDSEVLNLPYESLEKSHLSSSVILFDFGKQDGIPELDGKLEYTKHIDRVERANLFRKVHTLELIFQRAPDGSIKSEIDISELD